MADLPFGRLLERVRIEMRSDYGADSCIAAARLTVDVLERFGVQADGLRVKTAVYNRPFWEAVERGMAPPAVLAAVPEAWSVGLGAEENDKSLHVVAWAPTLPGSSQALLVDLAIDQATRPQHAMILTPQVLLIRRGIAEGFESGMPMAFKRNDCVFAYEKHRGGDAPWRNSPNWGDRDAPLREAIIARAMAAAPVSRAERRRWQRAGGRVQ